MSRARGADPPAARQPGAGHRSRVVDTHGAVLGIVRAPDAPIFGTDVSAAEGAHRGLLLERRTPGAELLADPSADVRAFRRRGRAPSSTIPTALTGTFAFADRSGGNLSRPYFPDGEVGRPNGPLSRPIAQFNPFSTGLQSALVLGNLAQHLGFVTGASAHRYAAQRCTSLPDVAPGQNRLQNGIQIFPGSVPIYRGNTLVGGIGVSGDGIDQDDMISFLGLNNGGVRRRRHRQRAGRDPRRQDRRRRWRRRDGAAALSSTARSRRSSTRRDQNVCEGL